MVEYNPDWPQKFRQIASWLMQYVPDGCKIHHVGSTSVPGMPAKDIIDLDIECPTGAMPHLIDTLGAAGYDHEGDKGISGREAFTARLNTEAAVLPSHHLYACASGAQELKKHLAFRDYLIANPGRAEWLAAEKIAIDDQSESRNAYIEGKTHCYAAITIESLEWANKAVQRTAFRRR
jgi:GrpB-like predicted nucleotidyltransferase (UPF0157 family)